MRLIKRKIQKEHPTKIIISSFAVAKNLNINDIPTTVYFHSPMQYIWTHKDEYKDKIKGRQGIVRRLLTPYLQKRDKKYAHFDKAYANSLYTAQEVKKIYHITSQVIYPLIDRRFYTEGYEKINQ